MSGVHKRLNKESEWTSSPVPNAKVRESDEVDQREKKNECRIGEDRKEVEVPGGDEECNLNVHVVGCGDWLQAAGRPC